MSLPWFPCYPNDLLGSLRWQMMTPEERGAYWQLLCLCYQSANGKIMAPLHLLSRMSGINLEEHPLVLEAFKQDENGAWYNERAYSEWVKRCEVSDKRADAGAKGAAKRWQKHKQNDGKPIANANTSTSTSTSTTTDTTTDTPKKKTRRGAPSASDLYRFSEFSAAYPQERALPDSEARTWWGNHVKAGDDLLVDDLLANLRAWCETDQFQKGRAWNIGKFLTEGMAMKRPAQNESHTPWAGAVNG